MNIANIPCTYVGIPKAPTPTPTPGPAPTAAQTPVADPRDSGARVELPGWGHVTPGPGTGAGPHPE